jgi:hypothetical protein
MNFCNINHFVKTILREPCSFSAQEAISHKAQTPCVDQH